MINKNTCSTGYNQNVDIKSSTTGATSRAGTVYLSRAHEFAPDFSGLRVVLRVLLVEQELSTYLEHMSSLLMLVGSCYSIFCFMCTVL